ncbi:MAG TPA: hypothetical protein VFZ35_09035 [Sphingomicrobium sp.]
MSMLLAAMMGWCGTKWPGWWWRWPRPNPPDPPEPWWRDILSGIIGAIGGIGALTIIGPDFQDMGLMGTAVLGFFGGVTLASIGSAVMGMGRG